MSIIVIKVQYNGEHLLVNERLLCRYVISTNRFFSLISKIYFVWKYVRHDEKKQTPPYVAYKPKLNYAQRENSHMHLIDFIWFDLLCLTPLSTII